MKVNKYLIIFTESDRKDKVIIRCSNYRAPVYAQIVNGFSISIYDFESIKSPNLIATYPPFSLDARNIGSLNIANDIRLLFLDPKTGEEISQPVAIETEANLKIEFDLATPVANTGCYLKYLIPTGLFEL